MTEPDVLDEYVKKLGEKIKEGKTVYFKGNAVKEIKVVRVGRGKKVQITFDDDTIIIIPPSEFFYHKVVIR